MSTFIVIKVRLSYFRMLAAMVFHRQRYASSFVLGRELLSLGRSLFILGRKLFNLGRKLNDKEVF